MSTYCTRSNVEDIYGVTNVTAWANINADNNATTIANRITRAILVSSETIDDVMRVSAFAYAIPLVDKDGDTPTTIEELAATLSGIWLYENLGTKDFNENTGEPAHRLVYKLKWSDALLEALFDGTRKTTAVKG